MTFCLPEFIYQEEYCNFIIRNLLFQLKRKRLHISIDLFFFTLTIQRSFNVTMFWHTLQLTKNQRSPCGQVANLLNCDIKVSEFKHQLHNFGHIQTNTLWIGMNLLSIHLLIK